MDRKCPGTLPGPQGMRLAVTIAEEAKPLAPILLRGPSGYTTSEAAAFGYLGVENHIPDIWNFNPDDLAVACRNSGVVVSALVSGQLNVRQGLSITSDDESVVEKALEGLRLFVDAAKRLQTGVVVGWVRGRVDGRDRKVFMNRQAAAMRVIDAYAAENGVPLYIEAINRYELDTLVTADEIIGFIRENGLASTYAHLDTFHMNIDEHSFERAIRKCGPLLGYMHVAENTRHYPGHDRLDFDSAFRALRDIGYDGFVSVECLPLPSGREAAKRAFEFLSYRYF